MAGARLPGGRIIEAKFRGKTQATRAVGVGGRRIFLAVGLVYGKTQMCETRGYLISFSPPDYLATWISG